MRRRAVMALVASALALGLMMLLFGGRPTGSSPSTVSAQPPPHYECFPITGPAVNIPVELKTQFGTETNVVVGTPATLCLPALKDGQGDLTAPHLKCYNIVGHDPIHRVNLITQFGVERSVEVGQATQLCVPALKAIAPAVPPGTPPPAPHYKCYGISGPSLGGVGVTLETQFGRGPATVEAPWFLCAPALKNGQGDLHAQHLKCYNIVAPAVLAPPVNLRTQFGDETNVDPSDVPTRLCVPAEKEVIGVGGVAELPAVEGGPAPLAEEGGGLSAGQYAAMIAGLAGAALVLGAGVLYARRRWVR
jgi:hypothetical protein